MGNKPKHTADEVIEAIRGSSGIKATIARRLGVHRNSVVNYLVRYATAQKAYDDEVEAVGDDAESVIIAAIQKEHDVGTAKWYARMKLQSRGYVERREVAGTPGQPLEVKGEGATDNERLAAIVAALDAARERKDREGAD